MATKFYTTHWSSKIDTVEIERESDSSVWVKGNGYKSDSLRRVNKKGSTHAYHDTWEDAHAHLLNRASRAAESLKERLQQARSALGQIESMKKPQI